jgi:dipeptidyl aminopeptidase/acylaminoacyl peptidase
MMDTNALRRGAVMLLAAALAPLAQAARPLVPDDIYRMESVSDPQLSPDGQWIAYLVSTSDREADEERSAVWMVSWDGKQQLRLTQPSADTSSPRWSPDGRYLAYLGKPAGDKPADDKSADADAAQVMLLDRRGGEPRALTHVTDDIDSFEWSPDGKRLAIVLDTDRDLPSDPAEAKKPRAIVIDDQLFKHDVIGYIGRYQRLQLFLCDVDTGKLERLSDDPRANDTDPAWSPDGRQIAFTRTHERGIDVDGRTDVAIVEARAGAKPRTLVRPYAPDSQLYKWSPDGTQLTYLEGLEPKFASYQRDELMIVPVAGGTPRSLSAKIDRAVRQQEFSADGRSLTLLLEDDRRQYPVRMDLASLATEKLDPALVVVADFSMAGSRIALAASNPTSATEIYALDGGAARRLTHHGDSLLSEVQLGAVEDFNFKSRDGAEIHGVLVKPPGYVPGRRYPTLLWIHGGPSGQDNDSLDFDGYTFERQQWAAGGYLVVGVNYRGSSGRGLGFSRPIFADWGHKEVEDLLAAIDDVVARGLADPERLAIGGWSYGGMLTDYTIASDTRFKAAMAGAGVGNALGLYGTDQYILQYNNELGLPWLGTAPYLKVSYPFFHADRIHTPTLFMGGNADFNVPIAGGEQMYTTLRTQGVPTQLVVYPDQHHILTRPSFIKDRLERIAAWYDHYLKGAK